MLCDCQNNKRMSDLQKFEDTLITFDESNSNLFQAYSIYIPQLIKRVNHEVFIYQLQVQYEYYPAVHLCMSFTCLCYAVFNGRISFD